MNETISKPTSSSVTSNIRQLQPCQTRMLRARGGVERPLIIQDVLHDLLATWDSTIAARTAAVSRQLSTSGPGNLLAFRWQRPLGSRIETVHSIRKGHPRVRH